MVSAAAGTLASRKMPLWPVDLPHRIAAPPVDASNKFFRTMYLSDDLCALQKVPRVH
jgi:hypothetical protein